MKYLIILYFSALFVNPCSRTENSSNESLKETGPIQNETAGSNDVKSENSVFLGRYTEGRLLIEDNNTFEKNAFTWAKDTMENYGRYGDYLTAIAKKYASYKEDVPAYFFDSYKEEFNKLTTLKMGDKLYVSTKSGVHQCEISGFYMNFDDIIGSGVIFYAAGDLRDVKLDAEELVVCSKNPEMSAFKTGKLSAADNPVLTGAVKKLLMEKAKDIKCRDESSEKEKYIPVTGIDSSELFILPGSYTAAGVKEFIAGYTKRQSFDNFAYYIIIVNEQGGLVNVFSDLIKDSFTFETVVGAVDINGDGIFEILTEDGYYEGAGYNLHMLEGGKYKVITGGFFFGV